MAHLQHTPRLFSKWQNSVLILPRRNSQLFADIELYANMSNLQFLTVDVTLLFLYGTPYDLVISVHANTS